MKLSKSFKPELLVADPDMKRPQWEEPFLSGSTIIALNGQIAAVFPCERETNDRDGPISLEAMSCARKTTPASVPLSIECGDRFVCDNGASFPRPVKEVAAPNMEQVTPREGTPIKFTLSTKRFETLMKALGGGLVEVEVREGGLPLIVRPIEAGNKAFGLIMTGKSSG